jgi:(2R)-sulfolactate sulfo-lyase subunit alpha
MRDFLVHDGQDNVGVVVRNVKKGEDLVGESLDQRSGFRVNALQDIPLGHKIALKDLNPGDTVIKYGEDIGRVVEEIRAGQHVHVHNLKTKRW